MKQSLGKFEPDRFILLELGLIVIAVGVLLLLSSNISNSRWQGALVIIAFLYLPILSFYLRKEKNWKKYGLEFAMPSKSSWLLLLSVIFITFVPYLVGFHIWAIFFQKNSLDFGYFPSIWDLFKYLSVQLLIIALPEEFFFRGYLQTRIAELPKLRLRSWTFFGANFQGGLTALLVSNGLFALSHWVGGIYGYRLLTFFPGLVFAWLWVRRKNLVLPIVYHAVCNLLLYILLEIYR